MKLLVFLFSVFIVISASGTTTDIQTVVDSVTGEQLYACNARIRHVSTGSEQECFSLSTGEVCHPENIKPGDAACVCRSKSNHGDLLVAETKNGKVQSVAGGPEWDSLVPSTESFGNQLRNIDIALGSESLGAEYAVTFCYAGPEELLKQKTSKDEQVQDLSEGKYRLDVSLAGSNYGRALDEVSFAYVCDQRDRGNHTQPRKKSDTAPPSGRVEDDSSYETLFFGAGANSGDAVRFVKEELILNQDSSQVPRFCVFEFKFREKSGAKLKRDPKHSSGNFTGRIRVCKQGSCP
ncbi:hypothetical protein ACES2J_13645 [Bdellovibrio bacteriovorus]|uniref:hypothetical protein n=1 Tax=Bdellovibrio bacteriovorus TaxID=959 RepID=UPI0035A58156